MEDLRESLNGTLLESYDVDTGVTRTLFNPVGNLTPARAGDPLALALEFVRSHLDLLGLRDGDLDQMEVCDSVYSAVSRSRHIYFCQRFQDLEIINAQLQVNVIEDGSIVSVNNSFVPGLRDLTVRDEIGLEASSAVNCAANHLGISLPDLPVERALPAASGRVVLTADQLSVEPIEARMAWLPVGRGLKRVWRFRIHQPGGERVYELTVDAEPGLPPDSEERIWTRFDLVARDQYRVYPLPIESPNHANSLPPQDGRQVIVNPAEINASMLGWHHTGAVSYTGLRGNNVHAYEDIDANNAPPANEPDCGSQLNCDFPINLNGQPSTYVPAAVTNLFYWANIIHDVQFQYGFDEAAGNFQINNFGRGGAGGDSLRAEGLDGQGINNANFLTLPDGFPPRMQMFLWNRASPARAGSFDSGVVAHEYGHGISIRQVGGPLNVLCLANRQQPGEGWADWLALVYTARVADGGKDARGIATYLMNQPTTGPGIRTQRYSTDPTINTHTYESIDGMAVPHGVGEVWGQALWEVYWALVDKYGFDPDLYDALGGSGNQRAMLYVNEGFKNTACSPTFTDARDGILQAAISNYGGEDVCMLWKAFAEFGLGVDAMSGGSSSTSPTNGFQVPASCSSGTLTGTLRSSNGAPIAGALVRAGAATAVSNALGIYSIALPAGTYDVSASAFGFLATSVAGVVIAVAEATSLDIELAPRAQKMISGLVRDGSGAGWPLYAHIEIAGAERPADTVFTTPVEGMYGPMLLFVGETYEFVAVPLVPGYLSESRSVTIASDVDRVDFSLLVDTVICNAPGYGGGALLFEDFEQTFPPDGWDVSNSTTGCAAPGVPEWTVTDPGGRNNFTGGSGLFAVADADACGSSVMMNTKMMSPPLDLSALGPGDTLRIEIDEDGGVRESGNAKRGDRESQQL